MLAYLLTKPPQWEVRATHLIKESPVGRDGVYSILRELESAGYLEKAPARTGGKFAGTNWIVREDPGEGSSEPEFPYSENTDADQPYPDQPYPDPPYPENPCPSKETEAVKTEGSNSPCGPPEGDEKPRKRKNPRTAAPDHFPITDKLRQWAQRKGIPEAVLEIETEQFLDHHRAKDSRFSDWEAAWRTWMTNWMKWNQDKVGQDQPKNRARREL